MSDISEKTKIPVAWAASIIMALLGVVFNAGIGYAKFNALENEFEKVRIEKVESDRSKQEQELKIQRLDITLSNIAVRL